jgi:hypothetical protein
MSVIGVKSPNKYNFQFTDYHETPNRVSRYGSYCISCKEHDRKVKRS